MPHRVRVAIDPQGAQSVCRGTRCTTCDPLRFYPFFWGHVHERGEGPGLGYNLNLPLPRGSADTVFLEALDSGLAQVAAFAPGALVVALRLDAFEGDPFGGLAVSTGASARSAGASAPWACRLPSCRKAVTSAMRSATIWVPSSQALKGRAAVDARAGPVTASL